MGWDYWMNIRTRDAMIDYITKPRTNRDGTPSTSQVRFYHHFWERSPVSHLWTVTHDTSIKTDGGRASDERAQSYITLFLLEHDPRGAGFGYKAIDESAVPYYFTCPIGFFDVALAFQRPNWRAAVRLYHSLRSDDDPHDDTVAFNRAMAHLEQCKRASV